MWARPKCQTRRARRRASREGHEAAAARVASASAVNAGQRDRLHGPAGGHGGEDGRAAARGLPTPAPNP